MVPPSPEDLCSCSLEIPFLLLSFFFFNPYCGLTASLLSTQGIQAQHKALNSQLRSCCLTICYFLCFQASPSGTNVRAISGGLKARDSPLGLWLSWGLAPPCKCLPALKRACWEAGVGGDQPPPLTVHPREKMKAVPPFFSMDKGQRF